MTKKEIWYFVCETNCEEGLLMHKPSGNDQLRSREKCFLLNWSFLNHLKILYSFPMQNNNTNTPLETATHAKSVAKPVCYTFAVNFFFKPPKKLPPGAQRSLRLGGAGPPSGGDLKKTQWKDTLQPQSGPIGPGRRWLAEATRGR